MKDRLKLLDDSVILSMYNSLKEYSDDMKIEIIKEAKQRDLFRHFKIVSDEFVVENSYKYDKIEIERLEKKVIKEFYFNISKLESKIPFNIKSPFIEPFIINSFNIIELNKAAKMIAEFINISEYTFIITPTHLDNKIAGCIEINSQKEVYIEISNEVLRFNNIVLATIAHEIVHQMLHVTKIGYSDTNANERLTDLACVYLGLGKIMLNGLWESIESNNYKYLASSGYLNLNEIVFILNILFSRYSIDRRELLDYLDGQKAYLILKTNRTYKFFRNIES